MGVQTTIVALCDCVTYCLCVGIWNAIEHACNNAESVERTVRWMTMST